MSIACQIADTAWLAIVSFDGLPPSWSCMPIICDFMASSHTRMCMQIRLFLPSLKQRDTVIFPLLFPVWSLCWTSRAQLCLCQLIILCSLALKVCRSAAN
jgi:hypothetical protein